MQKQNPVYDLVAPIIESMGFDVVRVLLMGGQRQTLQIMIERKDGKNLVVDDCAAVSRAISDLLDEKDPIDGKYSLEVSSPGIDRPLTKPEHFARFVGYETKIETDESVEGRKRFKGQIVALDDGKVIRFDMDGKEYKIPFDAVAKAKLVLNDELWAEYVEAQEEE